MIGVRDVADPKRAKSESHAVSRDFASASARNGGDDQEFYQLLDRDGISDDIHLLNERLREWEDYYNYHRPHSGLDGQMPCERLLSRARAEVSPGS